MSCGQRAWDTYLSSSDSLHTRVSTKEHAILTLQVPDFVVGERGVAVAAVGQVAHRGHVVHGLHVQGHELGHAALGATDQDLADPIAHAAAQVER